MAFSRIRLRSDCAKHSYVQYISAKIRICSEPLNNLAKILLTAKLARAGIPKMDPSSDNMFCGIECMRFVSDRHDSSR